MQSRSTIPPHQRPPTGQLAGVPFFAAIIIAGVVQLVTIQVTYISLLGVKAQFFPDLPMYQVPVMLFLGSLAAGATIAMISQSNRELALGTYATGSLIVILISQGIANFSHVLSNSKARENNIPDFLLHLVLLVAGYGLGLLLKNRLKSAMIVGIFSFLVCIGVGTALMAKEANPKYRNDITEASVTSYIEETALPILFPGANNKISWSRSPKPGSFYGTIGDTQIEVIQQESYLFTARITKPLTSKIIYEVDRTYGHTLPTKASLRANGLTPGLLYLSPYNSTYSEGKFSMNDRSANGNFTLTASEVTITFEFSKATNAKTPGSTFIRNVDPGEATLMPRR